MICLILFLFIVWRMSIWQVLAVIAILVLALKIQSM